MEEEKKIWEGSPAQWTNFSYYALCVLLTPIVGLGFIMAIWKYYDTKKNRIEITDQRIIEHKGIFSKTTNELELYRVKDIKHVQPFWLRIVGLSNIVLDTTDYSNPVLVIKGLINGEEIKEKLRTAVDIRRDIKGVREIDVNG